MYRATLRKPDGRELTLYSRKPLARDLSAPSPFAEPLQGTPHLRWHPLRGEWVTYAAYRQGRTFLPPPEYNPLAVTADPGEAILLHHPFSAKVMQRVVAYTFAAAGRALSGSHRAA